ncbi:MAG: MFS transporter [Alphaproteobacteria bacterium]|nr:MFS transporter [Alphaproteobacteria bacterium]
MSAARLIGVVFMAQLLAQIGAFTVPALLPIFIDSWELSHTKAGWLIGAWAGAYVLAVPILVSLTDRVDAKKIYLVSIALTTMTHIGYALFADGFWSAFFLRAVAGMCWAGTYMPGLKVLSDRLEGTAQTRGVSWHAAGVGLSAAFSFLISGLVSDWLGWHWAFGVAGICTTIAFLIMWLGVPDHAPTVIRTKHKRPALLDFRPVLRNRSALAYSLAYCAHGWEMFAFGSWAVTFLTFTAISFGGTSDLLGPTSVAFVMGLLATWSSVAGNELCIRFGRQQVVLWIMISTMMVAVTIGLFSAIGYGAAVVLSIIYSSLIYGDSSALTAGASGNAEPGQRGATLAVHSTFGHLGGFVGPLVIGIILDLAGSESVLGWTLAFGHLAIVMIVGIVAIAYLKPKDLPGDHPVHGKVKRPCR